jgi:mannosyl-oligosaccharide glucosidase
MGDENLLLSEDGLRSLSFSDPLYGTDDNYWRGAVWLPINYMVLRACKLYYWNDSTLGSEVRTLYEVLRERLIDSVEGTYKETGYLYENYYKGRGHRGFPFYGWTSTIVNIITEQY